MIVLYTFTQQKGISKTAVEAMVSLFSSASKIAVTSFVL